MNCHRKIAVVGAGFVGSATTYALSLSGLVADLVLVDVNKEKAIGEAMDLSHGSVFAKPVDIVAGDFEACAGAQIVIFTAGVNQQPGETRMALVQRNVAILKETIPQIVKYAPNAIILMVANPVDVLTYEALKISGLPEHQVIGSGTVLDTARFRNLLAQTCQIDVRNVHAYVLGEHGDTEVVLWSNASVSFIPVEEYCQKVVNKDVTSIKERITQDVVGAAYEIISRKGATYFGIGVAVKRICEAILRDESSILTVSSLVNGHYGLSDVCLSVPCIVNGKGRERILDITLSRSETEALHKSAQAIKEVTQNF